MKATDINLKKRHLDEQSIYLMLLNDKNRDHWAKLNQAYAHAKGMVLPEKF